MDNRDGYGAQRPGNRNQPDGGESRNTPARRAQGQQRPAQRPPTAPLVDRSAQRPPTAPAGQRAGQRPAAAPQGQRPAPQQQSAGGGRRPPASKQQGNRQQPPARTPRTRWFEAMVMVGITVGLCIFMAFFALNLAQDLFGLNQPDNDIEVAIPEGATNRQIADLLAQNGVVSQSWLFHIYAGLKVEEGEFQAGRYIFNSNKSYDQLIVALRMGDYEKEEVRLTFYEGRTLYEIATMLEDERICGAQDFLDYLDTAELDYEFIDRIPENPLRYHRLEGYIFPDTYDFYVNEKVESVAKKFLDNFEYRVTQEMMDRMMDMNLTLDEAIVLASIIQKEAGIEEEMRQVASVFHNRLDRSEQYPKLQSDVTIFYVESYIKPFLTHQNQAMYDAYNTYVCDGLPVGAICNPGLDAINAVLYPDNTDYYFFVTDVNDKYYYAETGEEHYRNVATASAQEGEGEIHGIDTQ